MSVIEQRLQDLALAKADQIADAFVSAARGRCSRRTGALADSIQSLGAESTGTGASCFITVGEDYGVYQDQGTGVYGPEGAPIEGHPLLAFDWPAAGGKVIVHSVKGSPGTHFWSDTVADFPNIVASV